jgi:ribonuclease R
VRVQVSRVDLDGRRIDFRLVPEGQDLPLRGAKERPADAVAGRKAAQRGRPRDDSTGSGKGRAALLSPLMSPIQSLKAAVKKAAAKAGRKQGKKPRR